MAAVRRVGRGSAWLVLLALVPAAWAESEALKAAVALYDKQEYVAAQEALLKIDRSTLTTPELNRLDELLAQVPDAIKGSDKARQDREEGDKAYEAGAWEAAEQHYKAVADNKYAARADQSYVAAQRARIAEKKKLVEAAKPGKTVEESVTVRTLGAPEAPEAAKEPPKAEPPPMTEESPTPAPAEAGPAAETEGPRRLTPTEHMRMQDELHWQRAVAQFQASAAKARAAMDEQDFAAARRLADDALQTIEAAGHYAEPASKYQVARDEALRLKEEVERAADAHAQAMAVKEREEIADRIKQRREQLEQQRQETVLQLFNTAAQLRKERKFSEAAEVLRQVLRIDPGNAQARYQLEVVEDYESFESQRDWLRDVNFEGRRALKNADDALIPWDYDVLYPKNWLELTAQRSGQAAATGGRNIGDAELDKKLKEVLPEIRFDEQPFESVVDFLTEMTKLNMSVDWTDLNDTMAINAREKPITIKLTNLQFRTVLKEILAQVGGETQLAFTVGDGLLRIATKSKLDKEKQIVIYDVRDLLVTVRNAPQPDYTQNSQGLGQNTGGGGGGQSVFGTSQQTQQTEQNDLGGQAEMEKLKQIIRQTVEPDSWVEAGAGPGGGSIQDLNGQLLIYNTSDAHRQVVDLLNQLRETQALQISVESRFLDVTSNFLEQFGVDLDFVFNSGNAGYDVAPSLTDPVTGAAVLIPRQFSRIGSFAAVPGFGVPMTTGTTPQQPYGQAALVPQQGGGLLQSEDLTPIGVQQNSLALVDPSAINTQVPGSWAQRSLQPALNITGSFLDNLQVDFLIRATQANARSSIVQAPRAVLTNGQSVEIRVETFRAYISSLEPVVGERVALPRPIQGNANSGVSMWVQGVISADRRYTKLSVSLFLAGEPSFERYELQRGSGDSPSIFLLLPRQARTTFSTTVSIPDGGTVLLGGFKQTGEVELEAGVPILNKIPILKRAFTNRTTVKDTRTLLILLKSKIMIQKEAEEEAFPTFSSVGG